jgi:hypothetical protein
MKDKVRGEWRKQHNKELNDLYSSSNIVQMANWRRMRWAVHVARLAESRVVSRGLVENSEGKLLLGRTRHRWDDNSMIDLP